MWLWTAAATAAEPCIEGQPPADLQAPQSVVGTVTRLVPLCVNGDVLAMPAEMSLTRDGRASTREALGLGHVVRIETNGAFPLVAERVDIELAIAGPIEGIAPQEGRLTVLRSEVRVLSDALIRGLDGKNRALYELERGDHVEVSGYWASDGAVEASRLDMRPAGSPSHVTGLAVPIGRDTLYVERVRGQTKDRMGFDPDLRDRRVQLRGKWNIPRQQLDEAFTRARPLTSHASRTLSLEGIATAGKVEGSVGFTGTPVEVVNGTPATVRLRAGSTLRVLATRDQGGTWIGSSFTIVEAEDGESEIVLPGVAPAENTP